MFELFHAYLIESGVQEDHIIKVSLDDEDYRQYRDPNELYEYLLKNMEGKEEQYYIFLDEVQFAISKNEIKNADEPIRLYLANRSYWTDWALFTERLVATTAPTGGTSTQPR